MVERPVIRQLNRVLIDLLIQQMAGVSTIYGRNYRPEAVIMLAAFAVIAQELAHVAYDLERPLDAEMKCCPCV